MKTKLCRPILIETKSEDTLISNREFINLLDGKIHNPFKNQYYELILISLDPDEKIEEGDKYYDEHNGLILTASSQSDHDIYQYKKVIATQSQLSPEYISKFVEEYNRSEVKDIEIGIENMKAYRIKVNSRKHIFCSRRESNSEALDFMVRMLIPASEIQGYFDSNFTIVYKWENVCIVAKTFSLHKETINAFYNFMNREDLC